MSGSDIVALFSVATSGVVGVAGAFLAYKSKKAEMAESYRAALYPRRLQAYQDAVKILTNLQNVVSYIPPLRPEVRQRFAQDFSSADTWWQENCLYLDELSADVLRRLFADVGSWAVFGAPLRGEPVTTRFNDAWKVILAGMGWKHTDTAAFTKVSAK
jgi:hypothetical protein